MKNNVNGAQNNEAYFHTRYSQHDKREEVWMAICHYLQRYISRTDKVLELGAGYCSFINNIQAKEKIALDIYSGFSRYAISDVKTIVASCDNLSSIQSNTIDTVFASNLLEHLPTETVHKTLAEIRRVLTPKGKLILIQPNFRYCYRTYFDDFTHQTVFTHISLADLVQSHGFTIEIMKPRFLPFSFKSAIPKWAWLVALYLRLPWRPLACQMLLVCRNSIPVQETLNVE